ncbi:MAG: hypothetical protein ACPGXZ_06015 [Saprospiraceae bacterium]
MKYRKKPIVIEAVELTKSNFKKVESFLGYDHQDLRTYMNEVDFVNRKNPDGLFIQTLEGDMKAKVGDYIIKGVKGEFYPCKPDIFKATYEAVLN